MKQKTLASRCSAKDHYSAAEGFMVAESAPPQVLITRLIAIEEVRNYINVVYIKKFLKKAGWMMHNSHPTPWTHPWP